MKNFKKIEVSELKDILVTEMKKCDSKDKEILELKKQLIKSKEFEIKYNATLVIIDSYKARNLKLEDTIDSKDKDIENLKLLYKRKSDDLNDYIIKYRDIDGSYKALENRCQNKIEENNKKMELEISNRYKDEIKKLKEVNTNFIKNLIDKIKELKGTLSKAKVLNLLDRLK